MTSLAQHRPPPAALRLARGVSFGNRLEAPPGDWRLAVYDARDFRAARDEGFDHVRLPVGWHHHFKPGSETIDPAFFGEVDVHVDRALAEGLEVVLDVHHFPDLDGGSEQQRATLRGVWSQIAAHYSDYPLELVFELLNEARGATTCVLSDIYDELIGVVRARHPDRLVLVAPGAHEAGGGGGGNEQDARELARLRLPADDVNLAATVHSYAPYPFTHQRLKWAKPAARDRVASFPGGVGNGDAIREALAAAGAWKKSTGRAVHLGEFGCSIAADPTSRARYARAVREVLDELGIGWTLWDWKAEFRYWDPERAAPEPGLREALFGA